MEVAILITYGVENAIGIDTYTSKASGRRYFTKNVEFFISFATKTLSRFFAIITNLYLRNNILVVIEVGNSGSYC